MASTGFITGHTAVVDAAADFSYTNLNNVLTDNSSAAQATSSGREEADRIKVSFSHSVPAGATIDGIEIKIRWRSDGGDYDQVLIQLEKTTVGVGANKSTGAAIPSTNQTITFGGAADLWSTTWTDSEVNASTFGVLISVEDSTSGADSVNIEAVLSQINYTAAASGPSDEDLARGMFANIPI